jgi:hypothetical protein
VLKKKTNNNGMLNPISYCFYVLPSVYISVEKNLQVFMRKKEENRMGEEVHPIPSRGIRPSSHPIPSHPIPWDNKFFKSVPWDGMGLSHPMRSPGLNILLLIMVNFGSTACIKLINDCHSTNDNGKPGSIIRFCITACDN